MRRWMNTAAVILAVAATAACGGEPTAPQRVMANAPRRTLTLGVELTAPAKAGRGEACLYVANAYGGSGTYYYEWDGVTGNPNPDMSQLVGWIDTVGLHYVTVTVWDGTGAHVSATRLVDVKLAAQGC